MKRWRPIPGFSGYWISDLGEVKSFRRGARGRVLRTTISEGYPSLGLWAPGRRKQIRVYQLVASAFLGPRPEGLEVRHLDGDKLNSRPSNLKYGTRSENVLDLVAHGGHHLANKTHCARGHEYNAENTVHGKRSRYCRQCQRINNRAYEIRKQLRAANYREVA